MLKKFNAITLIEIIISVTIFTIILIMLFSTLAKKAKSLADITSGTFSCYKDSQGVLHQKAVLSDGTTQEYEGKSTCNFTFPSQVTNYTVTIIGGGGGGGSVSTDTCAEKNAGSSKSFDIIDSVDTCYHTKPYYIVNGATSSAFPSECANLVSTTQLNNIGESETITNKISTYMENDAYKNLVLNGHWIAVKGGDSSGENKGVYCAATASMEVGNTLKYYNGYNEIDCSDSIDSIYISASPGVFQYSGTTVKSLGVNTSQAISDYSSVSSKCSSGSLADEKYPGDRIDFETIKKVSAYSCTGGGKGVTITTTLNLAGQTIVISKDEIGEPGKPNGAGGTTKFETANRQAAGGSAGSCTTSSKSASITKITEAHLTGASRIEYFPVSGANGGDGVLSDYISNNVLQSIAPANQAKYKGQGSSCSISSSDKNKCSSATSPYDESFGSGGGGAASMAEYDSIPYFKYTKYIYSNKSWSEKETEIISSEPVCHTGGGGNGTGGAIVISW